MKTICLLLAMFVSVLAQAAPLAYEMPENKAVISPGMPTTPSKLGSKYFIRATGGTPPYSVSVSGDAVRTAPRRSARARDAFDIIPVKAGEASITLKDAQGASVAARFSVQATEILKATLSNTTLGVGKSVTLNISGGVPPYRVDFLPPVRYRIDRLSDRQYRLTGLTAGGGDIRVMDGSNRSASLRLAPEAFVMSIARRDLKAGEETELLLSGGTAPYQFNTNQAAMLAIGKLDDNRYRIVAREGGTPRLTAMDAQRRSAQVQLNIQGKPVDVSQQPLTVRIQPQKIHDSIRAVRPNEAEITVSGGKPPYKLDLPPMIEARAAGNNRFRITGKGNKANNVPIRVSDSEGRKGSTSVHLVPQFTYDCRLQPIKVGSAGFIRITGGEPAFQVSGADPRIVRISQTRHGGLGSTRPGEPIETVNIQGLAPGSVRLVIHDLNNMYVANCPVTVVP